MQNEFNANQLLMHLLLQRHKLYTDKQSKEKSQKIKSNQNIRDEERKICIAKFQFETNKYKSNESKIII